MTVDSFGRVVVSGAGYVRILIDENGDGAADAAHEYVDGPRTGAQGMYFDGRDLLCSGDKGLLRYRDADGDDRADGPAEVILPINAGGEHDLHAIRRGPDGWWYVNAGNMAGINDKHVTLPHSPVQHPQAGTLFRIKPELSGTEVIAHGFRNAYDFDFHAQGDLFTFDSDGERDISLPWYRPTRVFCALPGSHAGWLSRSWKRPDEALDMPPVVAEFGRGSPTGVVCYRHTQFPEEYRNALFVLDWTYGRVMAVPLTRDGSVWQSEPSEFMTGVGQFGFAPTDAAVGPDGSLYVSVGGRGTRGGVYRIRSTSSQSPPAPIDELTRCLRAPQPLSSWSRREWEPVAERLGAEAFEKAALSDARTDDERVRAIEIFTEKFGGLSPELAAQLAQANSPLVRARAVWSMGCTSGDTADPALMSRFHNDPDPLVARAAVESLARFPASNIAHFKSVIAQLTANPDSSIRQSVARLLVRADTDTFHDISDAAVQRGWEAAITVAWAFAMRSDGYVPYAVDIGRRVLEGDQSLELKRDAARLIQIAFGDLGPQEGVDPVFDGYHGLAELPESSQEIGRLQSVLAARYPTGDASLDHELARIIGMIAPNDPKLFAAVLGQITEDSHPVDDLHHLIVSALLPVPRMPNQREHIADALISVEQKIERLGLNRDANWEDRVMEMTIGHVEHDMELVGAILSHPDFGLPGHVPFAFLAEDEQLEAAIDRFVARINADSDYRWTNDVVFLIGESNRPEVRDLLRSQAENYAVRSSILTVLSESPEPQDRKLFVEALDSHDLSVLTNLTNALSSLDASDDPIEQVALVRTLRRMGPSKEERAVQDSLVRLLQRNTGQEFDYELGLSPGDRQQAAISQWSQWAESEYPNEWARQSGVSEEDVVALKSRLEAVDWPAGDSALGEQLFHQRSCAQCHGGRRALGPDLTGAAGRFSRRDLFTAIAMPHRDVPPRYQATIIMTNDGQVHTGLVIYESVDGLVLRTSTNQTLRIETSDIDTQRKLNTSLMPAGLLKDLEAGDLADLYAYLQTLGAKTVAEAGDSQ